MKKYIFLIFLFCYSCQSDQNTDMFEEYNAKMNAYYAIIAYEYKTKKPVNNFRDYQLDSVFICDKLFKTKSPFGLTCKIGTSSVNHYISNFPFEAFEEYADIGQSKSEGVVFKSFKNKHFSSKSDITYFVLNKEITVNKILYKKALKIHLYIDDSPDFVLGTFLIK
jgi:hypothetical protein